MPTPTPATSATCRRCGHTWTPRVQAPLSCPRCHDYDWRTPVTRR